MIESGPILTGNDADLLRRALSAVKTKVYEESETSLDDTQALDAIVSCFRAAEQEEQRRKVVTRILAPCISGLSWVRFSIGNAARTVARVKRVRAERWMGAFGSTSRFSFSH